MLIPERCCRKSRIEKPEYPERVPAANPMARAENRMNVTPDGSRPGLSIVIPTLNEEGALPRLLSDLASLQVAHEVIVADGGSTDATVTEARAAGARALRAEGGRGAQLRAGAQIAAAPVLAFLHADARLGAAAVARLEALAVDPPPYPCAFGFRIDSSRRIYRLLEPGTNWRARFLGLPYGDQGLVIRGDEYWAAGGHPDQPLMEDVALARALARRGKKIHLLAETLAVSPRRWERDGPLRRTVSNLTLLVRYLLGASPAGLAARYRPAQAIGTGRRPDQKTDG